MNRRIRQVLVLVCCATGIQAQGPTEQARDTIASLREQTGAPALQAAVLVDGEIVFSYAIGLAEIESEVPATTTSRFRIASISKAITGAALARMASRGEIELDRPVVTFVPDLPEHWNSITARQLASHTSGIRHYRGLEIFSTSRYESLSDALVIFKADALLFEPGAQRSYSTYGFTLLGVAMEAAAGAEFMAIVERELLDPLRMVHTHVDDAAAPELVAAYTLDDGGQAHAAPATNHSYKIPGGGMVSTAEDLVRLGWAVIEPGHLDEGALTLLRTRTATGDGKTHNYSLGWNVVGEPGVDLRLSHGGSQPGAPAVLLVDVDGRAAVAILCNAREARIAFADAERIARCFAEQGG